MTWAWINYYQLHRTTVVRGTAGRMTRPLRVVLGSGCVGDHRIYQAVEVRGRGGEAGFQEGEAGLRDFSGQGLEADHAAGGGGHGDGAGGVIALRGIEGFGGVGAELVFPVAHGADQGEAGFRQVVPEEGEKLCPVLVLRQHVEDGHGVDEVEAVWKLIPDR